MSNKLRFQLHHGSDPSAGLMAFDAIVTIEDDYPKDDYVADELTPMWIDALAEIYDVNKDWIKRIE